MKRIWSTLLLLSLTFSLASLSAGCAVTVATGGDGQVKSAPNNALEHGSKKEVYHENTAGPPENEFSGLVYQGYLLPFVRENEWGWNIAQLSRELGIEMTVQDDAHHIYRDYQIPIDFSLQRGNIRLDFRGDVDKLDRVLLQNPYMATITYRVYKNNKELQLQHQPLTYRKGGPYGNLIELLQALEIDHVQEGATIFVDAGQPTAIAGKALAHRTLELASQGNLDLKLAYNYRGSSDAAYQDILLLSNNSARKLFDASHPGSAAYYHDGSFEHLEYQGEDFIQVRLESDTAVFKYQHGKLLPVFTRDAYAPYLGGSLTLETGVGGKATYMDQVNGVRQELALNGAPPNLIFDVKIRSFDRIEQDPASGGLQLVAQTGARYQGKIFFAVEITFVYDGEGFVSARISSIDWAKFSEDKSNDKMIDSMQEYIRFTYDITAG